MNKLDRAKKKKFAYLSLKEKKKQRSYFITFVREMMKRKELGDEKYGNYMCNIPRGQAIQELKEEVLDSVNHLIFLMYRVENDGRFK